MDSVELGTWVPGAAGSGFGIDNLPYGVVRRSGQCARPAVRVGDHVLDLAVLADAGLLDVPGVDPEAFHRPTLNAFIAQGSGAWTAMRRRLQDLLAPGAGDPVRRALRALADCEVVLPIDVGDYVDGYASLEHASNVGRIFRPGSEPLTPNWRHLPVAYHGRAGTLVVGGTPIRRPNGQRAPDEPGGVPSFGPERHLDFELELGCVLGPGPPPGTPVPIERAADHVFGFVLVNDWSAREIQRWEYVPLGPFLGKSFATSVAPWIVPLEALEPMRVPGPEQAPEPLPYLRATEPWALDVDLEVALTPAGSDAETVISRTNANGLYWSAAQQLAHATVNGASVRAGDLLASGTISGAADGTYGSLLELSWGGRRALELAGGERRTFLADGDTVVLRGSGVRGGRTVSFGEVSGRVEPAPPLRSRRRGPLDLSGDG